LKKNPQPTQTSSGVAAKRLLKNIETAQTKFNKETLANLSARDKKLNAKLSATNISDAFS
jgi:phospholipase C